MSSENQGQPYSHRAHLIHSLYDYTNNIAETRGYDSNRGVLAGTAAALLGVGLDRFDSRGKSLREEAEFSEDQAALIELMAGSASEHRSSQQDHGHFMDRFMDRLVKESMGTNMPESEEIKRRMHDPSRSNKPPLSVRIFTSNMKRLSGKMGPFFKLQYGAIHVITWRNPSKTLCVLIAYTCVCLWPHLVLLFPLLVLLFGFLLPAYLHRHPMDRPEILKVKKRGQSLLDYFNDSDENSLFTDLVADRRDLHYDDGASHVSLSSLADGSELQLRYEDRSVMGSESTDTNGSKPKKEKKKFVMLQVSMLINMRDLQNLTTDVLDSISKAEDLLNDIISFKNERVTTFVFYLLIVLTCVLLFLGQYIPWRLVFIVSGWVALLACHPHTKKLLVKAKGNRAEVEHEVKEKPKKENFLEKFDRNDIIVDDQPEVRVVEIFELQTRDVFKHEWKFYGYSKRLFDATDLVRMSGKLPHGVDNITKVMPPREWKFDSGYSGHWYIDTKPEVFLEERAIDKSHLSVLITEKEGWIVDVLPADLDLTREFRRRRLYRECYRYSRPAKEFKL